MSEKRAVERSGKPVTWKSLSKDMQAGGVEAGSTVLVHSSLNSLGWVCGGPVALIKALMEVITPEGNLVMPTHSPDYSEPTDWGNPAVPEEWWQLIREEMPAYQPEITPTRGMGVVPETFRKYPGVHRSAHPCSSFAAWGRDAREIVADHTLDYSLGVNSPLQKIYELGGYVLLIGVDHEVNTSLHLAEYQADFPKVQVQQGAPLIRGGERVWLEYREIDYSNADFKEAGRAYEKQGEYELFNLGLAEARLLPQPNLVDFAIDWFAENRSD